jgi:hypothetical protein
VAAVTLTPEDLTPFAEIDEIKAQAMIDDALALAALVAPCIADEDFAYEAAAKAILRGAILRWNDAGSGALASQVAGPFGQTMDTRQERRGMFWPSEIGQLQQLCIDGDPSGGAFEIDTMPSTATGVYGVDYWWTGPDSTSTEF